MESIQRSLECLALAEPRGDSSTCQCELLLMPEHYCMVWPDHSLFIHQGGGHLDSCFLVAMNSTAGNIQVGVLT